MSLPGLLGLMALLAALLFLAAMSLGAADAQEPPPAVTVTTTVPDRQEERRLVKEREQWRRTAHKRGRTIRLQRGALRRLLSRSQPHHPLEAAFQCIHSFEGAWGSNTGNGYYGGLQMDMAFQRAHGPEFLRAFGTANRWPASVQIAVGIRAWLTRGFQPWPTRRFCGL